VKIRSVLTPAFLVFVSLAASARADNSVCAAAILVVPDGSLHEGDLTASASIRWYRFVAKAGRSYALMLENLTSPDQQPKVGITGVFDACGGALVTANEFADTQEPVSIDPSFVVGATRQALKASSDAVLFFQVNLLDVSNAARFRVRVEETTLFNPFWSTETGLETHYRLFNTTNRSCSVTLDLRTDSNAVPAGGANSVTFDLAANTSVSRQTGVGGLNIQNGQSGHATIAHDCTPGAILADAFLGTPTGFRSLPVKITTARQQR
jgi:hypothetical protein